jgi:hypothetical protein
VAAGPRVELKLTTTKKVAAIACALMAPCSFGTTGLVILWMLYIWPTAVDAEGIQPRWGQKRLWRDLQEIRHVRLMRYGTQVGFRIEFKCRTGKAQIDSISFENATEAIRLAEKVTGRNMLG